MGNLRSVQKACEHLGAKCAISSSVPTSGKLVIPGVGAFGAAMENLRPLQATIQEFAASGQPLLGICLGQQLLFESSEELGKHEGLGLIAGRVKYLPRDRNLKVPHIGWTSLKPMLDSPLFSGISQGEQAYFVHSLYTDCADPADIAALATYGIEFPAAIQRGNIWGCQFHPEKSSHVGLRILRNFIEC